MAGRLVVVTSRYPVSAGELVIVEASSWLKEATSVIAWLSSVLVAVASIDSNCVAREVISSDPSSDVVLLSEGSVSTPEVASGMRSDEVGTPAWTSELVITTERSVGCVRTPVGVPRSELVLATPRPISALVVSIDSDAVTIAEDSSDARLDRTSVAEGRVGASEVTSRVVSVELKTSVVCASPIEVTDGESVSSAGLLANVDSLVRTMVGVITPVSTGPELVLISSRPITELVVSGNSDTTVSEEIGSDAALDGTSVAEGNVGVSVMICEIVLCASGPDVIDGSKSVVSARALVSESSGSAVELSITIELKVGMS